MSEILKYRGKLLTELTKEELIHAIEVLHHSIKSSEARHRHDLDLFASISDARDQVSRKGPVGGG